MQSLRIAFLCSITAAASLSMFSSGSALAQQPSQGFRVIAPNAQQPTFRFIAEDDAEEQSGAWIGVRMTPIPAPLAAHLGEKGLMVGNIAVDSPADKAGLQQYDIVTSFNGRDITDMQSLLDAVTASDTGKDTKANIVRKGEQKTLVIRPAERPTGRWEMKFKYEEPDADVQSLYASGKRLRRTPGGDWMMEDLGPLMNLPDFYGFGQGSAFGHGGGQGGSGKGGAWVMPFGGGGGTWTMPIPPGGQGGQFRFFMDDDDKDQGSMSFSMNQDDESLSVQRDDNGHYTVETTDEAGNKKHAEYESADEFRKEDPDTYNKFRQATGRNRMFFNVAPQRQQIPAMRQDFQDQLQKMIEESRRQADEAQRMLDQSRRSGQTQQGKSDADEKGAAQNRQSRRERRERVAERMQQRMDDSKMAQDELLSVKIADGKITVRESKDGKVTVHRFDSEDQLKQQQPELHKRVKPLLND